MRRSRRSARPLRNHQHGHEGSLARWGPPLGAPRVMTPRVSDVVLRVSGLVKGYMLGQSRLDVLRGLALSVPGGQMCAGDGPPRAWARARCSTASPASSRPTRARSASSGQDMAALDDEGRTLLRRRRIGIVYQFFNLVANLTARGERAPAVPDRRRAAGRGGPSIARSSASAWGGARRAPALAALGRRDAARLHRARAGAAPRRSCSPTSPRATSTSRPAGASWRCSRRCSTRQAARSCSSPTTPRTAARADRVLFMKDGAFCEEATLTGGEVSSAGVHDRLKALGI